MGRSSCHGPELSIRTRIFAISMILIGAFGVMSAASLPHTVIPRGCPLAGYVDVSLSQDIGSPDSADTLVGVIGARRNSSFAASLFLECFLPGLEDYPSTLARAASTTPATTSVPATIP